MKKSKFLLICVCICGFLSGIATAQISDERNLLDSSFVQYWNRMLSIMQDDCSVKISVSIFGEEKSENGTDYSLQTPELTVSYNDTSGFEIYIAGENNFVITWSLLNEVIPEANAIFKSGRTNEATEYVLMNVQEMLYSQKLMLASDDFADEEYENPQKFNKKPYLFVFFAVLVVFLFVILSVTFRKKKKPELENCSYFFKGMSKSGFFGGDFDKITSGEND